MLRENFSKMTKAQLQTVIDECKEDIERIKKRLKRKELSDDRRKVLNIALRVAGDRLTSAKREYDKPVRRNRHPGRKKKD